MAAVGPVDLLLELGGQLIPVEVKLTATPMPRHGDAMRRFRRLVPEAHPGFVVCDVAERTELGAGVVALPWLEWSAEVAGRLGLGRVA